MILSDALILPVSQLQTQQWSGRSVKYSGRLVLCLWWFKHEIWYSVIAYP